MHSPRAHYHSLAREIQRWNDHSEFSIRSIGGTARKQRAAPPIELGIDKLAVGMPILRGGFALSNLQPGARDVRSRHRVRLCVAGKPGLGKARCFCGRLNQKLKKRRYGHGKNVRLKLARLARQLYAQATGGIALDKRPTSPPAIPRFSRVSFQRQRANRVQQRRIQSGRRKIQV
jgi:hypothetical protein